MREERNAIAVMAFTLILALLVLLTAAVVASEAQGYVDFSIELGEYAIVVTFVRGTVDLAWFADFSNVDQYRLSLTMYRSWFRDAGEVIFEPYLFELLQNGQDIFPALRFNARSPHWVVLTFVGIIPGWCVVTFVLRRIRYRLAGCCRKCEYNLNGNQSGVCPECGTPIPFAALPSVANVRRDERPRQPTDE